jgi:hypothetical protein
MVPKLKHKKTKIPLNRHSQLKKRRRLSRLSLLLSKRMQRKKSPMMFSLIGKMKISTIWLVTSRKL